VGFFLRVCLGSSCKSFFSFSFFNKTPYYLSKKKKKKLFLDASPQIESSITYELIFSMFYQIK
jgi:hypothetical protein